MREKQKELHATLPAALMAKFNIKLKPGQKIGRVCLQGQKICGSKKYYQEHYADFMTICLNIGQATWMMTGTVNQKWSEILNNLYPNGQTVADRPVILCAILCAKFIVTKLLKCINISKKKAFSVNALHLWEQWSSKSVEVHTFTS